jgi:acyl-CoA dehydrogenase
MRFPTDIGAVMGMVDGPTEVHKVTVARSVLGDHTPAPDAWPTQFGPRRVVDARRRFDEMVEDVSPTEDQRAGFHAMLQESTGDDVTVAQMQAYLDATTGNL